MSFWDTIMEPGWGGNYQPVRYRDPAPAPKPNLSTSGGSSGVFSAAYPQQNQSSGALSAVGGMGADVPTAAGATRSAGQQQSSPMGALNNIKKIYDMYNKATGVFGSTPTTYGAGDTPANLAQYYGGQLPSTYGAGDTAANLAQYYGGYAPAAAEAATFGAGDTAANLAAYYGGYAPAGAGAAGAGAGAATFGAGDTAANLAAFYGGYTPVAAEGVAAAGAGAGAGATGSVGLGALGGMAAAAALPFVAYALSSHQDAKDEQRWNEAQQQYGPAFQDWINAHPEARDVYTDVYKQRLDALGSSGGFSTGFGSVAATKALLQKYPELPRIISENWIGKFFGNEYAPEIGELNKQYPIGSGYTDPGMGDA